ncbi:MAG: 16S rRNA (cytidine(1402)-2'-O)-methyltransferase [Bacteroidales bacterium]
MSKLFVVPTPIGNLEDITLRALKVLKSVDFILAEDTRTSANLLKHFEISTKLRPYHKFNEHKVLDELINKIKASKEVALISDAGTPAIADPGFLLVREALKNNIKVETLPGATAIIPALVNSGLPCDSFVFEGFIPHKKGRNTLFEKVKNADKTTVMYESPHRIMKTLTQLKEFIDIDRVVSVSRELTKIYEETLTGTLTELLEYFEQYKSIKGEFVIVVSPK